MTDKYAIPPGDLTLHKGQVLGTGGAGQVYKGTLRDKSGKRTVAVKVLEGTAVTEQPPHEFLLLRKALEKCLYVCRPLGYCVKDGQVCMVLHLYEKSLKKYIEERGGVSSSCLPFSALPSVHTIPPVGNGPANVSRTLRCSSEHQPCDGCKNDLQHSGRKKLHLREIVAIAKQLAEAVRMLHKNARIAHFDIKPDNVLLDASGNCYLCDFSIAHEVPVNASSVPLPHDAYGSTNYMSPEQVVNKPGGIGFAADSWGLAATILELATGSPPYADMPVMKVLNMLMTGTGPTVPASLEPRLAHILSRSFVVSPITRQDVLAMRHALSSLNEVLRIESGGTPSVPTSVLHSADILPTTSAPSAQSTPSLPGMTPTASVGAPLRAASPSVSAPAGAVLPRVTPRTSAAAPAAAGPTSAPGSGVASAPTNAVPAHRRASPTAAQSAPGEVDLLSLDTLAIQPTPAAHRGLNGAADSPNGSIAAPQAATGAPPAPPSHRASAHNGEIEPIVITAGANGCLGIKAMFRSCTRLLANPYDSKQMTGVVPIQRQGSPGLREAVSVSADGKLTWWDLCQGRVSGMSSLAAAAVPPGVVGRSVVANDRFVTVGTDRAALIVWQFPDGGTSWIDANEDRAAADEVRCNAWERHSAPRGLHGSPYAWPPSSSALLPPLHGTCSVVRTELAAHACSHVHVRAVHQNCQCRHITAGCPDPHLPRHRGGGSTANLLRSHGLHVSGPRSLPACLRQDRPRCAQVAPQCVAVTHVSSDIGRPAATNSESNRMYDLALQPRWGEDAGGRWVAAASSLGNLVLWDTSTWQEIFCAKATAGSIYSCNALPGCALWVTALVQAAMWRTVLPWPSWVRVVIRGVTPSAGAHSALSFCRCGAFEAALVCFPATPRALLGVFFNRLPTRLAALLLRLVCRTS